MNARTLLGIAAAGTLAWSHGAVAGPHDNVVMNNGALVVITPFSPNESGPAERPEQRLANLTTPSASTSALAPVITPLADNEVGPNELRPAMRNALAAPDSSLMPNPQTPWSVSESGADSYGDYLAAREQQVVAFEHARIAAAEWNAQVAAIAARNAEIAAAEAWTADGQPALGATAGSGVGLTLEGGSAVGVLEGPRPAGESAVWNVEPLTPNADLTTGQTVVILPGTADTVVVIPGEPASGAAGAAGPL
jgi:hypothetical protein